MNRLFEKYNIEGVTIPYTMEDYLRETREDIIGSLTGTDNDKILKGLGPEDRLKKADQQRFLNFWHGF